MSNNNHKFYSLLSDTTFKYLFKKENTFFFFRDLIKYYTDIDIKDFTLIDNELSSGNMYVNYRTDIILVNKEENILINVELNREHEDYTELRNRRYLHTLASKSKNSSYTDKRIVIQFNLNSYKSNYDEKIARQTIHLYDKENDITIGDFVIHSIFIPEEVKMCYNEDIKKKLQLFLCKSFLEMHDICKNDKELNIIVDELERLNEDKYYGGLYNIEEEQRKMENTARNHGLQVGLKEGHDLGLKEGHDLGLKEGEDKKAKEIILEMYKNKMDIETISKITKLSSDEINEIINKSKD